ncbi:MAG: hypothetical protein JNL32_03575, partial [Candidatus Kapabacteria bacterium]|nr:hypothetical protein [Candidatus Kapabacteria bacterium]
EATGREWKTPVTKAQLAKQPELAEKLVSVEQVNKELAKRGEEMKAEAASKTKAVPKPTAKPVKQAAAVAEKKVAYKSTAAKTAPKKATTKKSSN